MSAARHVEFYLVSSADIPRRPRLKARHLLPLNPVKKPNSHERPRAVWVAENKKSNATKQLLYA
jgi:hypothetical protein